MRKQNAALRGIAILFVLMSHSSTIGKSAVIGSGSNPDTTALLLFTIFSELGIVAVPMFLFISGNFSAYSIQNKPIKFSISVTKKNISHIIWPYFFWSIIFYVLIFFEYGKSFTLWGYIKNLIVGYPFHFVPILFLFYLITPIIGYAKGRWRWLFLAAITIYQILLIIIINQNTIGIVLPQYLNLFKPKIVASTFSMWGIYYPLGLLTSAPSNLNRKRKKILIRLLFILFCLLFILACLDIMGKVNFFAALYLAPLPFVLMTSYLDREAIPYYRKLEELGKRSYSLYLQNLIVLDLCILLIKLFFPVLLTVPLILFLTLIACLLTLPVIVLKFLETRISHEFYRVFWG